jgi:hypothetical protein
MAKKQGYLKRKQTFSGAQVLLFALIFAAVGAVAIWQSLAAPHNSGSTKYTGSISYTVSTDRNGDGLANWDDTITWSETSNYTDPGGSGPWISVACYQNSTLVYSGTTGFGPGYPWPWTKDMQLQSTSWTGGAADCSAKLYYYSGHNKYPVLATLSFHVNA